MQRRYIYLSWKKATGIISINQQIFVNLYACFDRKHDKGCLCKYFCCCTFCQKHCIFNTQYVPQSILLSIKNELKVRIRKSHIPCIYNCRAKCI